MSETHLRTTCDHDLALLSGGDTRFDDWGPAPARDRFDAGLESDDGGLTVESDGVAGFVSWHYTQGGPGVSSRFPNVGIWLRASHRGRGIGAQAQRQLAQLFFAHTNVNRVEAVTDVENTAERRALERAGYRQEGIIRGAQWRAGAYHDMCIYSVLRAELDETPAPAVART